MKKPYDDYNGTGGRGRVLSFGLVRGSRYCAEVSRQILTVHSLIVRVSRGGNCGECVACP